MNIPDVARSIASSRITPGLAAVLCLAVAAIHVTDQGGLTVREPRYVGLGYLYLESEAVIAAVALVVSGSLVWWLLALGVAGGPLAGYVLSRSVGLPGYTNDIGNWAEPLGIASLIVEAALLLLATAAVVGRVAPGPADPPSWTDPDRDAESAPPSDLTVQRQ